MNLEKLLRQAKGIQSEVRRYEREVGTPNHQLNAQISEHVRNINQAVELERKKQKALQSLRGVAS